LFYFGILLLANSSPAPDPLLLFAQDVAKGNDNDDGNGNGSDKINLNLNQDADSRIQYPDSTFSPCRSAFPGKLRCVAKLKFSIKIWPLLSFGCLPSSIFPASCCHRIEPKSAKGREMSRRTMLYLRACEDNQE